MRLFYLVNCVHKTFIVAGDDLNHTKHTCTPTEHSMDTRYEVEVFRSMQ